MNIDEWKLLRNGAKVDLVKDKEFTYILPIKVSAYLLPKLERKNGNLTIGVCIFDNCCLNSSTRSTLVTSCIHMQLLIPTTEMYFDMNFSSRFSLIRLIFDMFSF